MLYVNPSTFNILSFFDIFVAGVAGPSAQRKLHRTAFVLRLTEKLLFLFLPR